jgi:protein-tyrosine phosphatase
MMEAMADAGDEHLPFRVVFVCTGNICRSPMAEAVFRSLIAEHGYDDRLHVWSAGTGDWHVGERADPRTRTALTARGYDADAHRARQFDRAAFDEVDLVVAFDRGQERILRHWAATEQDRAKVALLLSFDPEHGTQLDVPDPYYSDAALFDSVLTMIERSSIALFRQIEPGIRQGAP